MLKYVFLAALAALVACGGGGGGNTMTGQSITVTALAGPTVAEAGATVITTQADGTAIDEEQADGDGVALVQIAPGAFVSVIFPGEIDPTTTQLDIVTTTVPAAGTDLVIHGPKHVSVPVVAAGLTVMAPALPGAMAYTVDLGCNTIAETALPAIADVISPCESLAMNVDVLVRGYDTADPATQTLLGYGAGRVPLGPDEMDNEVGELDISAWATTGTIVPVTQTGVSASVALNLISDGLVFETPPIGSDGAMVWDGLVVDSSVVTAQLGSAAQSQLTMQYGSGAPAAIDLGAVDFLPSISPALVLADRSTLGLTWVPLEDSAVGGADALDVRVTWTNGPTLVWDVIVPPDISSIAFPVLDAGLQQEIVLPAASSIEVDGQLTAIDSSDLAGFGDLQTFGIDAANQIVPIPLNGEIRTSAAIGFASQ